MLAAARRTGLVLGIVLLGCGAGGDVAGAVPASVVLAGTCAVDGIRIEVEGGVLGGSGGEAPCSYAGRLVSDWRVIYQERWGTLPLDSWTVRVRAPDLVDTSGHIGLTWYDRGLIEVSQAHFEVLPHELHHAREGAPSNDHHGWCADFVPWELTRQIQDERSRLGCAP